LFRQRRVGKDGREFTLLKFRTMTYGQADAGPGLTCQDDQRITPIGRVLRKWKLDELPQLINVLVGDMSLVGPRPDLAKFWSRLSPDQRSTLCLRPGITGRATLEFRNEEALLCKVPKGQLNEYYLSSVLPEKVRLDWEYAKQAKFLTDCKMIVATLRRI
jgi:lipopolysaccharide/colanic/teichoic acid biosynthesis glycosyltransferase